MQKKTLLSLLAVPAALSAGASASIDNAPLDNIIEGNAPTTHTNYAAESLTPAQAFEKACQSAESYLHDEALAKIYGDYQKAGLEEIEAVKEAAKKITVDSEYKTYIDQVKAIEQKYRDLIGTQEANKAAADKYIADVRKQLTELSRNYYGITNDINNIERLLNQMSTTVESEYKKHALGTVDHYNSAIATALSKLIDKVSIYDSNKLMIEQLDTAVKEIEQMPGYIELGDLYADDIKSLKNIISGLTSANNGSKLLTDEVNDCKNKVEALRDKVKPTAESYTAISEDINELDAAIKEAKEAVAEKAGELAISGIDPERYGNNEIAALQSKADALRDELAALMTDPRDPNFEQNLEQLAAKVAEANSDNGLKNEIASTRYELFKTLTQTYLDVVTDTYNKLAHEIDVVIAYPGAKDVQAMLDKVYSYQNGNYDDGIKGLNERVPGASITDERAYEKLNSFNGKIKILEDKLKEIDPLKDKVVANHNNYDALNKTAKTDVQDAINKATQEAEKSPYDEAQDFYKGMIAEHQKDLDKVLADILADYEGQKIDDNVKAEYNSQLNSIKNQANETQAKIKANEDAHNNQLEEASETLLNFDHAEKIYEQLKTQDPDKAAAYLSQLEALKKRMLELNNKVGDSYTNCKSASDEITFGYCNQYKEIRDDIEDLLGKFLDDIQAATMKANYEMLRKSRWGTVYDEMWKDYHTACDTFDDYLFAMTNEGYNQFITSQKGNKVTDHAVLFDYSTEINNLSRDLYDHLYSTWSDKEHTHLLEQDELDYYINNAEEISARINTQTTEMTEQANSNAIEYFNQQFNKARDERNALAGELDDKHGISETVRDLFLADIDACINDAKTYQTSMLGNAPHLKMSRIADIIDEALKLIKEFDKEAPAQYQWADDYAGFQKTYKELKARLESEECSSAPDLEKRIADFNKLGNDAGTLYENGKKSETLYDDLAGLQDQLDRILGNAENIVTKAANDSKAKIENDAALKEQWDVVIPGMESDIEILKAYADNLAVEHLADFASVEQALDYYRETLTRLQSDITNSYAKSQLNSAKSRFDNAVNTVYRTLFSKEKLVLGGTNGLTGLLGDVKVAFNNINKDEFDQYFNGGETYVELNYELDSYVNEFFKNGGDLYNPGIETIKGTHDRLIEVEVRLSDLLVQLRAAYAEAHPEAAADDPYIYNPVPDTLAQLGALYDETSAAINDAKGSLAQCMESVQTEFAGKYEELAGDLETVKADWEDDGNAVMLRKENYTKAMAEIANAVKDLADSVAASEKKAREEKAKQDASNARYEVLKADLDATKAEYEAFKQLIADADSAAEYIESNGYKALCTAFDNDFQNWAKWLEDQKAAYGLTATSVWDRADVVKKMIADYVADVNLAESKYHIDLAKDIVARTKASISGGMHIDQEELENKIASLASRANAILASADTDKAAKAKADAKQIVSEAEALLAEAEQKAFILGDLDNDGDITSIDTAMLLDLVANGAEYDGNDVLSHAADLDMNGRINLADVVGLVSLLKGENPAANAIMRMAAPAQGANFIEAALVGEENGVYTYAVNVKNATAFVGGQFDIELTGNAGMFDEAAGERADGMDMISNDLADGRHRVIILSQQLDAMPGNEGSVFTFKTFAKGSVKISNALFVDAYAAGYEMEVSQSTGIGSLTDGEKSGAQKIYDTAGRMINRIQRGINIIVNHDGKVSKEIRK